MSHIVGQNSVTAVMLYWGGILGLVAIDIYE